MSTDLRALLEERIDDIAAPAGDLAGARVAGRKIRRRRRTALGAAVTAVAVAVGGALVADGDGPRDRTAPDDTEVATSLGALDLSEGLRAYGDPGGFLYLGGRKVAAQDLEWLDTDAVATPYGVVFYDEGRPTLLDETGSFTPLLDPSVEADPGFMPTAKAEGTKPLVAWAIRHDGRVMLALQDVLTREVLATTEPDCGRCADLTIEGVDGGVVFVHDGSGVRTWDSATGDWADFAGPRTRVADVRNGVVLYSGPPPTASGEWRPVPGAIDAQLTLDGRHVLSWSSTLEPTTEGADPIVLEQGPSVPFGGNDFGWWTVDTDGSILVATGKDYGRFRVYDCLVPSGACEELGVLEPTGGDPMFIGNDM